jgi:hypothetical protein
MPAMVFRARGKVKRRVAGAEGAPAQLNVPAAREISVGVLPALSAV